MKKTLAILGFTFICLLLSPNGTFGQKIRPLGRITVDPAANLDVALKSSFSITEDNLFLIPDQRGTIKVFSKEGDFLKFVKALGPSFGEERFVHPRYCAYSRNDGNLAIIDYGVKRVFLLKRSGKVDFTPIKSFRCRRLGYDIESDGGDQQLIVSGYSVDKKNKPFDLYSINIRTTQIIPLLPSHEKYNQKTFENYVSEYRRKQTLPAVGVKAYIDIQGYDLFFVWEGELRIIKINLCSKEKTVFGHATPHYTKPDASKLSYSYIRRDFEITWEERKKMAYVRNIFATPKHVFLVYEMGKNNKSNASTFRLQMYTLKGDYLEDVSIPGNPTRLMWLDEESYELYAFSKESNSDEGEFKILKYKIMR